VVKIMYVATATPGLVNSPLPEYKMLSRGLSFMSCLVVIQDEGWAVLCSLTNKTQKLNLESRNRQKLRIYIPSSCLHLVSLVLRYERHRQLPDLDIT
jgi:hypothetical protein